MSFSESSSSSSTSFELVDGSTTTEWSFEFMEDSFQDNFEYKSSSCSSSSPPPSSSLVQRISSMSTAATERSGQKGEKHFDNVFECFSCKRSLTLVPSGKEARQEETSWNSRSYMDDGRMIRQPIKDDWAVVLEEDSGGFSMLKFVRTHEHFVQLSKHNRSGMVCFYCGRNRSGGSVFSPVGAAHIFSEMFHHVMQGSGRFDIIEWLQFREERLKPAFLVNQLGPEVGRRLDLYQQQKSEVRHQRVQEKRRLKGNQRRTRHLTHTNKNRRR